MKQSFIEMVTDLIEMIPNIEELPVSPHIFVQTSEHKDQFDCDSCNASKLHRGDNFDPDICVDCWKQAATEAYEAEKEEEKNTRMLERYGL